MDKKKANDFTENLTDTLSDTLKEALEKLAGNGDLTAMKESAKEVADVASDFIKKHPIQSVLGAVAIGFLLGSLTSKRKSL